ncbi:MAG: cyclopropane fatty acyl phospholipid synthase [Cyanobacteriota bacterium]|nr:cyclopropane fatty acyl phospholipid synthase [Cyanobacteriota bacterium]
MSQPPALIRSLTERVDVGFAGERPWDLQVHDPALYGDLLRRGSLALGEGYVNGAWDCEALDQLFTRLLSLPQTRTVASGFGHWGQLHSGLLRGLERWVNWQSRRRSFAVGEQHYDIDPRVYGAMLDSNRIYSCAYWHAASDLETAQHHKLQLICQKLELAPGMRLLDVGCGWGGLAAYAARHFGVEVVGITVSAEQARYCQQTHGDLPFSVLLCDYRAPQLQQLPPFDRIVSIGMMEHVGRLNDRRYFEILAQLLRPDGLVLIQTIGSHDTNSDLDPWINTYIFPNGRLPSAQQVCQGFEPWFLLQDWENFGFDYDRTLMAWWQNFERAWPQLNGDLGVQFYRLWKYYLLSCAGFFRSSQGQLWQFVLSKKGVFRPYRSLRPRLCELANRAAAVTL